ncbi:MAG: GTP-sensing pleiotropic transcriptional regulator CodY [Schwartzia sp.]|nr:GTP-sensing pleiotropic transcriptional regulator CodY [Schwartzia sp. (in: firmicutes)]MBR1886538.1 GTP-sensing pleiotropic transcriptional regulator CodY [Schwartzia sp. (in: firmicutes)]
MATLLEKTRKINRLLQRMENVDYASVSNVLCNVIGANVYIADIEGKISGHAFVDDFECSLMVDKVIDKGVFPKKYAKWLLKMEETSPNLRSKSGMCAFTPDNTPCDFNGKNTTIVPIYGVGERIGTLVLAKYDEEFTDDDLILAEYGAAVVGMEMLRERAKEIEVGAREQATVQIALATLSFSELKAADAIISKLNGMEGLLIASKVADENKITRSVIVNALRKFESAGIIESRSLGMKGTYIKVLNKHLLGEIEKLKR